MVLSPYSSRKSFCVRSRVSRVFPSGGCADIMFAPPSRWGGASSMSVCGRCACARMFWVFIRLRRVFFFSSLLGDLMVRSDVLGCIRILVTIDSPTGGRSRVFGGGSATCSAVSLRAVLVPAGQLDPLTPLSPLSSLPTPTLPLTLFHFSPPLFQPSLSPTLRVRTRP